jgi:hypothetical protein
MPRPKSSGRNRKTPKTAASAKTKRGAAASPQAPAQSEIAPAEMTIEDLIRELDEVRKFAVKHKRAAAAVNATVAIGRLLRLLPDKRGRPPAKFDGNYNDAARRIALLLGLATKQKAEDADKVDGQKRDRPS